MNLTPCKCICQKSHIHNCFSDSFPQPVSLHRLVQLLSLSMDASSSQFEYPLPNRLKDPFYFLNQKILVFSYASKFCLQAGLFSNSSLSCHTVSSTDWGRRLTPSTFCPETNLQPNANVHQVYFSSSKLMQEILLPFSRLCRNVLAILPASASSPVAQTIPQPSGFRYGSTTFLDANFSISYLLLSNKLPQNSMT